MDVPGRMIRVQNESFDVCRAEMEHARFMVINPNDGMIVVLVHGIGSFSFWRSMVAAKPLCDQGAKPWVLLEESQFLGQSIQSPHMAGLLDDQQDEHAR